MPAAASMMDTARQLAHRPLVGMLSEGMPIVMCSMCGSYSEAAARGLARRCVYS